MPRYGAIRWSFAVDATGCLPMLLDIFRFIDADRQQACATCGSYLRQVNFDEKRHVRRATLVPRLFRDRVARRIVVQHAVAVGRKRRAFHRHVVGVVGARSACIRGLGRIRCSRRGGWFYHRRRVDRRHSLGLHGRYSADTSNQRSRRGHNARQGSKGAGFHGFLRIGARVSVEALQGAAV